MRPLVLEGFIEEIQTYIADNYSDTSGRSYTVSENFIVGDVLDIEDFDRLVGQDVDLTIYDEVQSTQRSGRHQRATRGVRFLLKGSSAQDALDRGHAIVTWLSGLDQIELPSFFVWVERFARMPGIVAGKPSGAFLADFVVHFLQIGKT